MAKTVFSGVQPTGNLHIGNYLGSIVNWLDLQEQYNCIFGIMDLHAITVPQEPKKLRESIIETAIIYLACGLDPKKVTIFVQSQVSAHAELAWVLGCMTPMGWLNRMTQFKDKSSGGNENLGLYAYPVLMACDILAYHSELVPVGQDQKQHLELTRDLAGAFNRKVGNDYFKLPEPLITKQSKRIMSLQDGNKKMSKSDESELSRINLNDSPDLIIKKLKKAKTDSFATITYDENRPEIFNLLGIFAAFSGQNPEKIAKNYENSGFGAFKNDLAEIIVEKLQSIQYNIAKYRKDESFVANILQEGQQKANEIANKTKKEVFSLIGL